MELLIAAVLANWIGQAAGWWGPWFSSKSSGGGRAGGSGSTSTVCGDRGGPTKGSGGVRRVGSWLGNATGWNDARRDGKAIVDRDEPPVTWGQAWREGLESGKQRGRDRFDEGQRRKAEKLAERDAQQDWLEQAEQRAGKSAADGAWPGTGRVLRRLERKTTCPDCGHGNRLNDSRVTCPCSNEQCACGDPDAVIDPAVEDDFPDYSKPLDDEQRWGPPGDVDDEPSAPAADPESAPPAPPVLTPVPDLEPSTDSPPPADGETDPEKETPMSAPAAPMPSMSGEFVNYDSARTSLATASTKLMSMSERQTELAREAADVVAMCDAMMAGLQAVDSDPEDIGDFMALREQAQQNLDAATKAQAETAEASAYCGTVTENINKRHAMVEEAMRGAKHVAKREAYLPA